MIDLKFILKATTVVFMTIAVSLISSVSFAKTEVRIMWYGDGETEGKAMQDQLDKFMAKNSDISVILDQFHINQFKIVCLSSLHLEKDLILLA